MKKHIKNGFIFGLTASFTMLLIGITYAAFQNINQVSNTDILTASDFNKLITNQEDLKSRLDNLEKGKVLQVISTNFTTDTLITSSSYVDTGHKASITPKSTDSKILVLWNGELTALGSSVLYMELTRNGTSIIEPFKSAINLGNTNQHGLSFSFNYLDSPSSTSKQTYKIRVKSTNGGSGIRYSSEGNSNATLTLMEIAN